MKEVLADAERPHRAPRDVHRRPGGRRRSRTSRRCPGLYVVKTDGLAAGKGVLVTESLADARDAVREYLAGRAFGDAGRTVVIEEGLTGPELSLLVLCDGIARRASRSRRRRTSSGSATATPAPTPAAWARTRRCRSPTDALVEQIMERAVDARRWPALAARDIEYRGVLYAGLMLTPEGPKVHRVQRALRRSRVRGRGAAARERPRRRTAPRPRPGGSRRRSSSATTPASRVVLASEGYPTAPRTGDVITGLDDAAAVDDVIVFHAGTARDGDGDRHRRRAGARRDRARRRRRRRPREGLRRGRRDLVARHAAAAATSPPHPRPDPGGTVIPRYSLPEMAALFTDEAKFGAWLEVEILATEAWAELGVVPKDAAAAVRERGRLRRRRDRRARADHRARRRRVRRRRAGARRPARGRVGALRPHVERRRRHRARAAADPGGRPARSRRPSALDARDHRAGARVPRHADGRAHARHPRRAHHVRREARALGAAGAARRRAAAPGPRRHRGRQALRRGRHVLQRRPVRGAARLRARSGSRRCRRPRCSPATGTPSCSTRARRPARRVEQFALEIRHLQRTEVREVEEPFRAGKQKGSSAMPHKRNPVKSEQLCGLARVLRGRPRWPGSRTSRSGTSATSPTRRSSGSSSPTRALLAYYLLVKFRAIVEGMHVYPERMIENLDARYGLVFSQPVLLALVEAGRSRDDAYRMVQRNAMKTWDERRPFLDVLREDPEVTDDARRRRRSTPASTSSARRERRPHVRRARRIGGR